MAVNDAGTGHQRGRRRIRWAVIEIVLAVALVFGTTFAFVGCTIQTGGGGTTNTTSSSAITTATQSTDTTGETDGGSTPSTVTGESSAGGLASPAEAVAEKLGPSVVNIAVTGFVNQPPFGQQQYGGEGSGVIYTADGMIVTNNHVVSQYGDPVDSIEVTLTTGEKVPATIVGRDALTDLAVIKIDASMDLPAATFNTDLPSVGEYAVAIGSPLGFENSVTLGIISGVARSIEGLTDPSEEVALKNLLQTDAPISPGNSGGALANASGEVIGINVAYLPPEQTGAVSIGFAIPSVVATKVADEIIETGAATHAYMGVMTRTVTPELQQQFGLSRSSGVLVAEVTSGGPADKAGIQQGDIIVEIDGEEMLESSDVLVAVRDKRPGEVVEVTVDRDGGTQVIDVTLEERPPDL